MDEYTWYGNQTNVEGAAFGALAVIEPMIQKINLAEIINQHLPVDAQAEWDHGTVLSLLTAARLYSPVALSNVAEWAETSGADILWNIPADKLNDDRLGRSLDAFFTQRHSILASLALNVATTFNIPLDRLHYDPTHILFSGAYAGAAAADDNALDDTTLIDDALRPASITKGRTTDDAPKGTRMVHAGLTTFIDELGPLPLFGHTLDGNQNGRTGIRQQLALIRKLLKPRKFTMISDRGTFSVAHLLRLKDANSHAICSVPWNDVKTLFHKQRSALKWKTASFLSLEQKRRRDTDSRLPQEHYELAVLKHSLCDDESGRSISCRVLFVFSTADQKVVRQQRRKRIDRITAELRQIEKSVAAGRYNNKFAAVSRRVAKAFGTTQADRYFSWELKKLTARERKQLPPPGRGCRLPTHRFYWSYDEARVRDDEQDDGYSAIVTTVPPSTHSGDRVFTMFREQNLVEHANRQFKGPLAVRPVFLHSPKRVEALVFLLMIALMVYFLVQRAYRSNTDDDAPQKERRMTAATILKTFSNYTVLIHHHPIGREVNPTRLTIRQRNILNRLEFPTPAQTLSRRLPRPPD